MTDTLKQKEINLYGSSRLGIYHVDIDVQNCNIASPEITKFTRGNKSYELNNHLGNVLATISDKHVQVDAPGNTVVDYYTAELITATDYYPFGMQMPQRQFYIDTTTYIVGTTSTEASAAIDTTVVELYKHSFSDTPSVHPYVTVPNVINANLSNSTWTNNRNVWTNYASNTSMGKAIAFDNSTSDTSTITLTLNIASGKKVRIKSFSFYNRVSNSGYRHWKMYINGIEVGDSLLYYPATGGTGNNTVKSTGTVQVKNAVENLTGSITVLLKLYDHDAAYPNGNAQGTFRMDDFVLNGYVNADGGSAGSGYQYANRGGYRYGFNGKEQDPEVKGEGNQYDYGFRIYDPRLGRFLSVDPLFQSYPWNSPYAFAENEPVSNIDLDGLEKFKVTIRTFLPYAYVWEPTSNNIIDEANVRSYPQYKNVIEHGGFKSEQQFDIDFYRMKVGYEPTIVPKTFSKDLESGKIRSFENTGIGDKGTNIQIRDSYATLFAKISTKNPATTWWLPTPSIDYKLSINVDKYGNFSISGIWEGFPAIEIFLENTETGEVDLIYFNNTSDAGKNMSNRKNPEEILNLIDGVGDVEVKVIGSMGVNPQKDKTNPDPEVSVNKKRFSEADNICGPEPDKTHVIK